MIRPAATRAFRALLAQSAKRYVAGDRVEDAERLARRYAASGFACTLGFWDRAGEDPDLVLGEYLKSLAALESDDCVAIKLTALDCCDDRLDALADRALEKGVRLHFDALGPESADSMRRAVERLAGRKGGALKLGYTLPGRWRRSRDDADWACELGLSIRLVKGQFEGADDLDPHLGFLSLAGALAGRKAQVALATHNPVLCAESLALMQENGPGPGLEQLHGLPMRRQLKLARARQIPATVYIAYGQAYLPYLVPKVMENPKILFWILRNSLPV